MNLIQSQEPLLPSFKSKSAVTPSPVHPSRCVHGGKFEIEIHSDRKEITKGFNQTTSGTSMKKGNGILNGNYANEAEISAKIHLPILCSRCAFAILSNVDTAHACACSELMKTTNIHLFNKRSEVERRENIIPKDRRENDMLICASFEFVSHSPVDRSSR